jgi:hypothetical protein
LVGTLGNGRDAPKTAIGVIGIEPAGSTPLQKFNSVRFVATLFVSRPIC